MSKTSTTVSTVHVPPAMHLVNEVAALENLPRNEAVMALKALKTRELDAIGKHHLAHIHEHTGLAVVTSITALRAESYFPRVRSREKPDPAQQEAGGSQKDQALHRQYCDPRQYGKRDG